MHTTYSNEMNILKRIFHSNKIKIQFLLLITGFIIVYELISLSYFSGVENESKEQIIEDMKRRFEAENENFINVKAYSVWDDYIEFTAGVHYKLKSEQKLIRNHCLSQESGLVNLTFDNFERFIDHWKNSVKVYVDVKQGCASYFKIFKRIYDFKFKTNHLQMNQELKSKVKELFKDDENLVNRVFNQVK